MDSMTAQKKSKRLQVLRSYYGDYIEESFQLETEHTQIDSKPSKIKSPKIKKKNEEDTTTSTKNPFWLSISGFAAEQTHLVYRFFLDIGHIIDKRNTDSNTMYLKYRSFADYEVALSYDNQKIGYGGDIHVRIKPEKPMLEQSPHDKVLCITTPCQTERSQSPPVEVTNQLPNYYRSPICIVEMEVPQAKTTESSSTQVPVNPIIVLPTNSRKKLGFVQWLKQKVSYVFYFY